MRSLRIFFFSCGVQADEWFAFDPLTIDLLLSASATRLSRAGGDTSEHEWLGSFLLMQQGSILDPDILSFRYSVEPRFEWGQSDLVSEKLDYENQNLNYFVSLDILRDTLLPVRGTVSAIRNTTTYTGSNGARSDTTNESYTATMRWQNAYMPIILSARRRSTLQIRTTATGSVPRLRDDERDTFRIEGRSTKTRIVYEHETLDDKVPFRNNDYDYDRFEFAHYLAWGRNSRLSSNFYTFERRGFNFVKRTNLRESLRIQHLDNVWSETEYSYSSSEQNQKSVLNRGAFRLNHRYMSNLTSGVRFFASEQKSDNLLENKRGTGLSFSYGKSDLKGMNISAYLSGDYEQVDRDSRAGLIEVFEEPHTVPLSGDVLLDSRYVIAGTIVVTDADAALVYREGIDYEVVPEAGGLTRLFVLPGSLIAAGDLLLVSYKAARIPSVEYSRLSSQGGFNLKWRQFRFSYSGRNYAYQDVAGQGGALLEDRRDNTMRLDYFFEPANSRTISGQLSAERRKIHDGEFRTTTSTFTESLSGGLSANTSFTVSLSQSYSRGNSSDADIYYANARIQWRPRREWSIQPMLGYWQSDTKFEIPGAIDRTEQNVTAGLDVKWTFRKLSVDFNYYHNAREINGSETGSDYVYIGVRRQIR